MLTINQLCGFGSGGLAPLSVAFVTSTTFTTGGSTHSGGNYNAVSIGAEAADRKIIMVIGWGSVSDQTVTIASTTIGGVTVTGVVNTDTATGAGGLQFVIVNIPTGTTANISIVFSGTVARSGIAIFRVTGLNSSTAHATGVDTAASSGVVTTTLNVPANGFCIGGAITIDTASFTWTAGLTETSDVDIGGANTGFSTALQTFVTAQTPLTVTATAGSGSRSALAAASWGN